MREPVRQITIRVPAFGRDTLRDICARFGVSRRAFYEAVLTVSLADEEHPVWRPVLLGLWAAAKGAEEAGVYQEQPREKIVVHLAPELAVRFKAACERHGVSQNAALGLMLIPHPAKETPEVEAYRRDVVPRLVELARTLDHERRSRKR